MLLSEASKAAARCAASRGRRATWSRRAGGPRCRPRFPPPRRPGGTDTRCSQHRRTVFGGRGHRPGEGKLWLRYGGASRTRGPPTEPGPEVSRIKRRLELHRRGVERAVGTLHDQCGQTAKRNAWARRARACQTVSPTLAQGGLYDAHPSNRVGQVSGGRAWQCRHIRLLLLRQQETWRCAAVFDHGLAPATMP